MSMLSKETKLDLCAQWIQELIAKGGSWPDLVSCADILLVASAHKGLDNYNEFTDALRTFLTSYFGAVTTEE